MTKRMSERMSREEPSSHTNQTEPFPHKNHTLYLLHRLIDKFNNFTETRIKLLKRNQSQLVKSLNDFLSNRHQHFQLKLNQTRLRQMFELEKRTNRTSKTNGKRSVNAQRLLEVLAAEEQPDQPQPTSPRSDFHLQSEIVKTKYNRYNRQGQPQSQKMKKYSYSSPNNTMVIKVTSKDKTSKKANKLIRVKSNKTTSRMTSHVQPSKMSKMLSNLPAANNSINSSDAPANQPVQPPTAQPANHHRPSNSTEIDCASCPHCEDCKQATKQAALVTTEFKSTTPAGPHAPLSWKQVLGQRFVVKKSPDGASEHSSTINSTMDILIRPKFGANHNSSAGGHPNLNLQSILKKSKLLGPRHPAKQTMPNSTFQTNYLAQDGLTTLPACTILDVFCWCYRLTRFLFIVRY